MITLVTEKSPTPAEAKLINSLLTELAYDGDIRWTSLDLAETIDTPLVLAMGQVAAQA